MLSDKDIDAAVKQLADYRKNDALTSILTRYETLLGDYTRLKSDFEEEREARERWKQQARGQERSPFVVVLVDADGYVFNDDLVTAGADGGTRAAQLLNDTIKTSQKRKGLENCETVIRVYANVAGLSKALARAGLVGYESRSLAPFIAEFNRTYSLTDFVDAGQSKENADFKLRGMLRFYADNVQCKHIYFAACHDSGYVSELMQYRGQIDRFTLIMTSGLLFHQEFTTLGLGIEELSGVFRSTGSAMDALYPKPTQSVVKLTAPAIPSPPAWNQVSETREICTFHKFGKCKYGETCKNLHSSPSTSVPVRSSMLNRTWRGSDAGDALDHYKPNKPQLTSNLSYLQQTDLFSQLPREDDIPNGHVPINSHQQRLDPYMQPPTSESNLRLKTRATTQKLCNAKHLSGLCTNPDCEYDHGHIDEDIKSALWWLARSLPCPMRERCRKAGCHFGHTCQKSDCKYRGGKVFCKLASQLHFDNLAVDRYVPAIAGRQSTSTQGHSPSSPIGHDEDEEDATSPAGGIPIRNW